MIIKESKKKDLPIKNWNNVYCVADFDRTLTKGNSKTSWSILASSNLVPEEYKGERQTLYEKYRPIEIDETIDPDKRNALVKEWYMKHIELFVKYGIEERLFIEASENENIMEFRSGAKKFLKFLHEHDVPLIIISAGIGNFIECFLKSNDCYYDNIYVSSNIIEFTQGIATGVNSNIIHSLNKNEVSLPQSIKEKLKERGNVILLGDQRPDLKMVDPDSHSSLITTCFMNDETEAIVENYAEAFDILIEKNEDYNTLMNLLIGKES